MKVVVFDLGNTLMEYSGMPLCWTDYYQSGFKYVNSKFSLHLSHELIQQSCQILSSFNPRINYREQEYSPEFIFEKCISFWPRQIPLNECISCFWEGLQLKPLIYDDSVFILEKLRKSHIKTAVLTDLPNAMPDKLFQKAIAGLLPYLDLYVSSSTCGWRKPSPFGLFYIKNFFKADISEMLFIGDEEKDRQTARNAGCEFIFLNRNEKQGARRLADQLECLHLG